MPPLEAAPGSATCDGRRFQDPKLISLSPWHNGWTEITPFQYAAALGGKGVLHVGVGVRRTRVTCQIREKNYGYRTPPFYSLRVSIVEGGPSGPALEGDES